MRANDCRRSRVWLVALLVTSAVTFVAAQPVAMQSMRMFDTVATQMEPTVLLGEAVLIDTEYYRSHAPSRGDVVMFIGPHDQYEELFRIVGLPGEFIEVHEGRLFIDDRQVPRRRIEDYVYHYVPSMPGEILSQYVETLPPGPDGGAREHRILKRDDDGVFNNTKVFVVPPDHYFVLGDNRDNSADSRTATLGFVPRTAIVGKAISHAGSDIQ